MTAVLSLLKMSQEERCHTKEKILPEPVLSYVLHSNCSAARIRLY